MTLPLFPPRAALFLGMLAPLGPARSEGQPATASVLPPVPSSGANHIFPAQVQHNYYFQPAPFPFWQTPFPLDPATSFAYLPPTPPALASRQIEAFSPKLDPALRAQLVDFAAETFYVAYARLLSFDLLSSARVQRITRYRESRDQLLAELRAHLDDTRALPESQRTADRRAFAAAQNPRLQHLEDEAEAIRADLTAPGFFKNTEDGTTLRNDLDAIAYHVGESRVAFARPLLAAQLFAGLSLEQRGLLREIAMEDRARLAPSATGASAASDHFVFFSPATARIRPPATRSAELETLLQRYETGKQTLKIQLRSAVAERVSTATRTERFTRLALQQAPAFAALDELAEAIRAAYARLPYPDAPARTDLPPDLTRRVGEAVATKAGLQRELTARYKTLRRELGADNVEIVRTGQALGLALPAESRVSATQRKRLLPELSAFNADLARRYARLAAEMETLRRDLQAHAANRSFPDPAQDVNRLAAEFNQSYAAQEIWQHFRDYHTAVLEPGLSPAQRRLLYHAALVELLKSQPTLSP